MVLFCNLVCVGYDLRGYPLRYVGFSETDEYSPGRLCHIAGVTVPVIEGALTWVKSECFIEGEIIRVMNIPIDGLKGDSPHFLATVQGLHVFLENSTLPIANRSIPNNLGIPVGMIPDPRQKEEKFLVSRSPWKDYKGVSGMITQDASSLPNR